METTNEKRIKPHMLVSEVVLAMADNDREVASLIIAIIEVLDTCIIDALDELGIYGRRIFKLYRNVCGDRASDMVLLLDAALNNIVITPEKLIAAIDDDGVSIDIPTIRFIVCEKMANEHY